ncbi:unnamed protein product [Sphagnum jensenii]|uniref:Plethodontid modulating factor n=1 Tax=Sphagnum jensenii TaxID=128206 RepID=A0ABP0X328_9BRYO
MNHDERKLAGFKCILLLTIWLILCWVLQAMEVAIDHIGCCTSKKQGRRYGSKSNSYCVFEDGEQRGGVSCDDDDDLCHDEYSIVVVVFVNLKICETLCCF